MGSDEQECMFCRDAIPRPQDGADNLAFMSHIEDRPDCRDQFEAWTTNMQDDWKGD